MTIIYIAGPISGIKDHNRPLFNMVAADLAEQGHSVLNPATLPDGLSHRNHGKAYLHVLAMVAVAHELVMLPGWEQICMYWPWLSPSGRIAGFSTL